MFHDVLDQFGAQSVGKTSMSRSEGNWDRDRLTDNNIEDYKKKLGHTKATGEPKSTFFHIL